MVKNTIPDNQSLEISKLRKRWKIIFLQLVSTAALLALMNRMIKLYGSCSESFVESYSEGSNYWCPSYEHTRGLIWFREQTGSLVLPDVIHGLDQTGNMTLLAPLIMCAILTAIWIYTLTAKESISRNIRRLLIGGMLAWGLLPFAVSWIAAISSYGFHFPWESADELNHLGYLSKPVLFIFELVFLGIVFAPILSGLMGIWGLSRKLLTWTIGYYLTIIGIHAILTFEGITESVDLGLSPLPAQIGEATLFGGLVSPLSLNLLAVAILLLVYLESGSAVISNMEYASMLPGEARRDPEYVRQFNNVLNGHIAHLIGVMALVSITTAIALEFDDFLISTVSALSGGQWAGQVRESLELQLTYGKVISAGLFLIVVAGMRFVLPWQRVTGIVESTLMRFRSSES